MNQINLLLDEQEILILRSQARMLEIFMPELDEGSAAYIKKILDATNDAVSPEARKEIGKMQRALQKIKQSPFYPMFLTMMETLQRLMMDEMQKEE